MSTPARLKHSINKNSVCLLAILILLIRLRAARKSSLQNNHSVPIENSTAKIYQIHDTIINPIDDFKKPKSLNQSHLPHPPNHLLEDTIQ